MRWQQRRCDPGRHHQHAFGNAANPNQGKGFDRSLQRFDITPMFAINVSRAELDALASDSRVVRIHHNKLGRAMQRD